MLISEPVMLPSIKGMISNLSEAMGAIDFQPKCLTK
jgi:hypothetical protein